MKIAIYTLGCKVNQYETQAMEQALRSRGHEVVAFSEAADAYMVNSCSVTAVSDQKSRQALHKIRREHPKAVLALCGCYAQTHPDDVENLDVDLISGTGDRRALSPCWNRPWKTAAGLSRSIRPLTAGNSKFCPPEGWKTAPAPC